MANRAIRHTASAKHFQAIYCHTVQMPAHIQTRQGGRSQQAKTSC